jgi:hypothetical protein
LRQTWQSLQKGEKSSDRVHAEVAQVAAYRLGAAAHIIAIDGLAKFGDGLLTAATMAGGMRPGWF